MDISKAMALYRSQTGIASAEKRGRNPVFPYVPVIRHALHKAGQVERFRHEQVRGFAYVTRDEAITKAQHIIDARVKFFGNQLHRRGARALREQYGLPREFPEACQ